jgi:hypothetical protein
VNYYRMTAFTLPPPLKHALCTISGQGWSPCCRIQAGLALALANNTAVLGCNQQTLSANRD